MSLSGTNRMRKGKIHRRSVEYNLTEHCNLRCRGCGHASPLLPEKFASLAAFRADLEALAEAFHSDELRIVGGEPLLHPQLLDFLREARRINVADRIVLYTNGVLLYKASVELWQLVDEIYLSVYPGVRRRLDEFGMRAALSGERRQVDHLPSRRFRADDRQQQNRGWQAGPGNI